MAQSDNRTQFLLSPPVAPLNFFAFLFFALTGGVRADFFARPSGRATDRAIAGWGQQSLL
ncbi:hypothetical protein A2627_01860 [Candidatus Woesebacteria bacterium RIFCSPHIGHO2_01_FULL_39_28]|uniref:Uncharacterized protein n=1 Tax=Candidatus Woesebacteria bacterium RIFCSPHIGHO2_01_FULL_39_28 TaxID=1802496 RepID=A0A1F7YKE2_9BACT|nr:MAG: hypothetical protein A2627_01860 [Candidatus Woesebacteria bacterium RIFCSPHIGHO2_01_FULL_39_28]OGM57018.1 MAG: hypothetical protein A3A50_03475 [Candidatus Woesebacteria bacterium RIFCSPLOWO2_01_FULL_38_20]